MDANQLLIDVPNPFSDGIVQNPWQFDPGKTPDIASIHHTAFALCVRLLEQDVPRNGQSSLLIDGIGGVGKTHFIARLLRWARTRGKPTVVCYVNLNGVAPQRLWTHIRKQIAGDLLLQPPQGGRTGLEHLLEAHLPGLISSTPRPKGMTLWDLLLGNGNPAGRAQIRSRISKELFDQVRLDVEVRNVLLKLFDDDPEKVRLARDWFEGGRLSEEQLGRLGLSVADLSDQACEQQSREIVISLLRLSGPNYPIVLCFDQVEQLMQALQDRAGYARFGQAITVLRGSGVKGLFCVSFIRTDQRHLLADAVGTADWHRLAENKVNLSPLTWEQACELVKGRMQADAGLAALRRAQPDSYWPLDERKLRAIYHTMRLSCTPRELLWACKDALGPGGEPQHPSLEEYLLSKWQQKRQQLQGKAGEDHLLHTLNAVPWLSQLLGCKYEKVDLVELHEWFPNGSLFLQEAGGGRIVFSACPRTPQLYHRFDKLGAAWRRMPKRLNCVRLVLLCDTRVSDLTPGAQSRAQTLVQEGVLVVCPAKEQTTALEAVHSLFTEASKGDLVLAGRTVSEEEVHQWAQKVLDTPAHEVGMLRVLFDELGLDVDAGASPKKRASPAVAVGG